MPLNRYQIRNEYSLADPDLYRIADKDDPEALLEGVAMAGLVGVLRQLGDLAEFAAEIFHDLHEEVMATAARGHGLIVRVQQLEAEFPSIERTLLSQTSHTAFLYNSGIDWHPNLNMDQNLVTREDLPRFVMDSYEECRGPPRLFLLDKFDVAGAGACLKRYTDPSFFKLESTFSSVRKPEGQREKRTRKMKKRGIRGRNGETPESFPSSHAKLHQLFLEERIENGGSDLERRVKLKKRQLSGTMSDQESGKNYMEKFLETCLQERTVHEISVDPLPLTLVPYNNDSPNESGLGIVEIQTISPPKESSQTDKMSRATTETWKPVVKPSLDELKEVTDTESIEVPRPKYDQDIGEIPSTPTKDVNEEELPNTESPSEHTSDEYSPGEATSEVEDYMDALPTMESEGETDSEYKRNLHYRSIKPIVVDSEGSEGPHDLQTLFPDSQSVGNSTASGEGNCFFRKERDNFSCSDTISNFGEDPSGGDGNVMTFNHRTMAEETPGNKDEKHVSMGKPNDGLDPEEASGTSCITDLNTTLLLADTGASPRENSVPKPELDELSSGLIMPDSVAAAIGQEWPDQSTYSSRRRNYYEMNSEDPIISSESLQDPPNVTNAFEDDGGARDPINKIQSELSEADSVPKMVDDVMDSSNSFGSPAEGIVDSNLPPIVDSNICPEESLEDRMSVLESTEVSTRQDLQIAETIDTNSPSQAYLSLEGLSYSCDEPSVKAGSAAADGEESAAAFPTVPQTGMSLPISEQLLLEETEASETPELDSAEDGVAHSQDGSNSRRSPETPQNDLMDGIVVVGKSSPVLDSSIPGPELPREITDSGLLPKHHSVEGGDTDIYSENDSNTEGLSQSVDGDKLYSPLNVNAVEKDDIHLDDATICPQQSASTPLAEEDTHSDDTETELVQAEAMGTYCHHNVSDGDKDEISHDVNLPVENADESGLGSISVGEVKSGLDHGIRKHDDAETVAAAARKDDVDYEHDQNDITESSTIDCSSPCFPEALQEESLFINEDPRQKDEDIKELQNHHCTDGSYSTLAKDMQNSTPPVGVLEASLSSEKNERDLESTSSRANTVFEDDISVCSHNLARQEEIVTPIQTSVDFPTGSIVGATSETCLGQPSLPESTKQTIEVASDACEQYENLTRCEPEPGLPTLGMLPGAFQVNLDETPPLPPLPPMQWRLGKLHHASLASARPLKQQTIDDVQLTPPPNNDDKTKMLSERSEVEEWDIPPLLATVDNLQNNTVCAGSVQDGPSISNHATLQTPENGPQLSEQESPRPSSNPLEQGLPDEGEEIQPKSDAKDEEVEFNEFVPPPRMGYEEVQPLGLTASDGERARSSHASDISSSSGDVHVNGTLQKKIPRPRNPLIDEVVAIDKSKLRKVGERVKTTTETKTEERESPPEWTQLRKVGVKAKSQDEPRPEQEWTRLRKVGVTAKSQDEPRPEPEWTQLRKAGVTVKSQDEPRPEPEWTQLRKVGVTAKSQAEPRPEPEWTQLRKLEVTAKSQDELRPEPEWAQLRKVGVTAKSQDEPRPEPEWAQLRKVGVTAKSQDEPRPEPEWAQLRKVGVTAKSQDEPRPEPEWAQLRKVGLSAKSQDELTTEQRDSVPENMPLKRVGERVKSEAGSTAEERDSLLEQIRNKSFSLKPAVATRPNVQGPRTNLKVAAILEKASTIRQAMAGSDEEDDADNWSDS